MRTSTVSSRSHPPPSSSRAATRRPRPRARAPRAWFRVFARILRPRARGSPRARRRRYRPRSRAPRAMNIPPSIPRARVTVRTIPRRTRARTRARTRETKPQTHHPSRVSTPPPSRRVHHRGSTSSGNHAHHRVRVRIAHLVGSPFAIVVVAPRKGGRRGDPPREMRAPKPYTRGARSAVSRAHIIVVCHLLPRVPSHSRGVSSQSIVRRMGSSLCTS